MNEEIRLTPEYAAKLLGITEDGIRTAIFTKRLKSEVTVENIIRKAKILTVSLSDLCEYSVNRRKIRRRRMDTLMEKCRKAGMTYSTVYTRLNRGWTLERALNTTIRKKKKKEKQPDLFETFVGDKKLTRELP